eukprot:scaffold312_cov409-Pavlova_lutheri.AAC.10
MLKGQSLAYSYVCFDGTEEMWGTNCMREQLEYPIGIYNRWSCSLLNMAAFLNESTTHRDMIGDN